MGFKKGTNFLSKKVYLILCLLLCYVLYNVLLSFLGPTGDDWGYFTKPNFNPSWADFSPREHIWRPFDVLFGIILGYIPDWFPALNHLWILFGHFVNTIILYRILMMLNLNHNKAILGSLIFFSSPAIAATTFGCDSINQTYALTYGLVATLMYVSGKKVLNILGWIFFTFLALLSKESGIVWFVATPMIGFLIQYNRFPFNLKEKASREFYFHVFLGLFFAVLYFLFRYFILNNPEVFGSKDPNSEGSLSIFSVSFVRNTLVLFGSGISSIDSFSLFKPQRNYFFIILTLLLNIPFLYFLVKGFFLAIKNGRLIILIGFLLIGFVVSSPHLILAHSAEMHAYPTVFFVVIIMTICLNEIKHSVKSKLAIVFYFIAVLISNANKWRALYDTVKGGEFIANEVFKQSRKPPKNVAFIFAHDPRPGYSVFMQSPLRSFGGGKIMKKYFDWKYPENIESFKVNEQNKEELKRKMDSLVQEKLTNKKFDVLWVVEAEKVRVLYP